MISNKKYQKALKIVLKYHKQIAVEAALIKPVSNSAYKSKTDLVEGDEVECFEIHGNSQGNLTIGKRYSVKRVDDNYFYIMNDQNKLRHYSKKNSQFKALL